MPAEHIDRAWLAAHGGSVLEMHLNLGREHRMVRRVVDRRDGRATGLGFTDISIRRPKAGEARASRVWWVDTHAVPCTDLDEALEILAIVRAGRERDERELAA